MNSSKLKKKVRQKMCFYFGGFFFFFWVCGWGGGGRGLFGSCKRGKVCSGYLNLNSFYDSASLSPAFSDLVVDG